MLYKAVNFVAALIGPIRGDSQGLSFPWPEVEKPVHKRRMPPALLAPCAPIPNWIGIRVGGKELWKFVIAMSERLEACGKTIRGVFTKEEVLLSPGTVKGAKDTMESNRHGLDTNQLKHSASLSSGSLPFTDFQNPMKRGKGSIGLRKGD